MRITTTDGGYSSTAEGTEQIRGRKRAEGGRGGGGGGGVSVHWLTEPVTGKKESVAHCLHPITHTHILYMFKRPCVHTRTREHTLVSLTGNVTS